MIGVHDQVEPEFAHCAIAEGDHVAELPGRVDVQQRERQLARPERLAGQMQEHSRILADRIEQHRPAELRRRLAEDVDAFRLERVERRQGCGHASVPTVKFAKPCRQRPERASQS
jgi:hypothetical protein